MGGHNEKHPPKHAHPKLSKPTPKKHIRKHDSGEQESSSFEHEHHESSSSEHRHHESSSSEHEHHESSSSEHEHHESSSSEHKHHESSSSEHEHHESSSSEHEHHESSSSEHEHHESSSSEHVHRKCHCRKRCRRKNKCKNDCLCKLLRKFKHDEITIISKTGKIIKGKLLRVKGCCVKILEPGCTSPFIPKRITVIRCKSIESFSTDCV